MDKKIIFAGSEISYRCIGTGFTVILLHGFAEDGRIWENQIEHLQMNYHLLIPDIPGSGQSPFIPKLKTIADFAEPLKAMLDAEGISVAVLIGHSMGGYIALAFAEKYPQYLKGLGLFHSTAFPDTEEKKAARKKSIAFIREYGVAEFVKTTITNLFASIFSQGNPQLISHLIDTFSHFRPEALTAYSEAMMTRPDRTAVLKQFGKPVMFIIGKEDKAVPFQDSLQQCHIPNISFIHIFWHSGHMGMIEEPEKAIQCMDNFLQNIFNKNGRDN